MIIICAIASYWFVPMFYIAVGLLVIIGIKAYRRKRRIEAERLAEEQRVAELEQQRTKRVAELLNLVLERDYLCFQFLLGHSYDILHIDEIMKVQEAFIRVMASEGIKPVSCTDVIATGKPCYYKNEINMLQQRQFQGGKYIDYDNAVSATMYIFDQTIELISTGHRTIKITDVLKIMVGAEKNTAHLLSLTIRNIGAPVLLICADAFIVKYIIETLQTTRK